MATTNATMLCAVVSLCTVTAAHAEGGLLRGGPFGEQTMACVSAAERANVARKIAEFERRFGPISAPGAASGTLPLFPHYPVGAIPERDLWYSAFVDLAPGPSIEDWNCEDWTYSGHLGVDTALRSFGEQIIGVPIFAVLDGTVVDAHDGEFDMNTGGGGQPSNYVIIDHGSGHLCYYWHMKQWSVTVSVGEQVMAGQQIGMVGSSGDSDGPHLHFETRDGNSAVEPWAGPCRPGASYWETQVTPDYGLYLLDFGLTNEDLAKYPGPPYPLPVGGQVGLGDPAVYFWTMALNLPPMSNWRVLFERPNGTIAYDSGTQPFDNPVGYRVSWWGWVFSIADMHSITGTWHLWLYKNNVLQIVAPIEVRTKATPDFNRPPEPISISFEPAAPAAGDVIRCNVQTSLTLDDVDYDIVQYEYDWTVNGQQVRHVTTAGQADAIPRGTAEPGDTVTVTVTPGDGVETGPTESICVVVGDGPCPQCDGDIDGDGTVGINDFLGLLAAWGPCPGPPDTCFADIDDDGTVGIIDFLALLAAWGPCE